MIAIAAASLAMQPTFAGPPFNTDFAEPIAPGAAEVDLYTDAERLHGFSSATLPGVQADYGVAPDFQARAIVPFGFVKSAGVASQYGLGDLEFGLEYRFLNDDQGRDWWPQMAVFPLLLAPTGNRRLGLGQGGPAVSLPIWLQKNFGLWKIYGGGGYSFDYGAGLRNSWFLGAAALRQVTANLALGGEVFHKTASLPGAADSTFLRAGGSYNLSAAYHIYFALGRSVQQPGKTGEIALFLALAVTF